MAKPRRHPGWCSLYWRVGCCASPESGGSCPGELGPWPDLRVTVPLRLDGRERFFSLPERRTMPQIGNPGWRTHWARPLAVGDVCAVWFGAAVQCWVGPDQPARSSPASRAGPASTLLIDLPAARLRPRRPHGALVVRHSPSPGTPSGGRCDLVIRAHLRSANIAELWDTVKRSAFPAKGTTLEQRGPAPAGWPRSYAGRIARGPMEP